LDWIEREGRARECGMESVGKAKWWARKRSKNHKIDNERHKLGTQHHNTFKLLKQNGSKVTCLHSFYKK
jgi:hypothetical protein